MEEKTILTSEQIEAALSRHRRLITLFKILTYGFGAGSILLFAANLIPVAAVCLVLTYVFGYQMGKHTEAQKKLLGESVVSGVLEQVFENVEYDPFRCIPSKLVEDAGMVFPYEYDSIQGSDHIKGVYKGLNVEFSDIELYHVEASTTRSAATGRKRRRNASRASGWHATSERSSPVRSACPKTRKSFAGSTEAAVWRWRIRPSMTASSSPLPARRRLTIFSPRT